MKKMDEIAKINSDLDKYKGLQSKKIATQKHARNFS
jgi:hypothetical protein